MYPPHPHTLLFIDLTSPHSADRPSCDLQLHQFAKRPHLRSPRQTNVSKGDAIERTHKCDCAPLRVSSWRVAGCRWDTAQWSWGSRCFRGCEGQLPPCTRAPTSESACLLERASSAARGSRHSGSRSHFPRLTKQGNKLSALNSQRKFLYLKCSVSPALPCLFIGAGSDAFCPVAPSLLGFRITYLFLRLSSW